MLGAIIAKDLTLLDQFIKFLATYNNKAIIPAVVANMPDVVALGIYMDFLEQEYGIGVTADNCSFIIYRIAVKDDNKHYIDFVNHMRKSKSDIVLRHLILAEPTTVMDRYIAGVTQALQDIIMPF